MTWKRFGYIVGLWVLCTMAVLIIADRFVLPAIVLSSPVLTVPNLAGKDVEFATQALRVLELQVMEPRLQYSEKVKKGRVMSQMPYAGAQVKSGRRIYLTVSRGVETVSMPSVVGLSLRDARLALMRVGLNVDDVAFEFNDSVAANRIVSQSVSTDAQIPAGGSVSLVISQGSTGLHPPDLRGLTLDEAKAALAQSGLIPGKIRFKPSEIYEGNSVISQFPDVDSLVPPNSVIDLMVAQPK